MRPARSPAPRPSELPGAVWDDRADQIGRADARAGPGRPAGPRRPVRDLHRARPPGRCRRPLGIPRPPQAPDGRADCRIDVVGAPGPGLVDRRPVRRRIAAVRPRRGPRLRQRRRGPLGRGDLLRRLTVLHLGRVPDLPGGRGRRPAGGASARRRFFVFQPRRIDWWATAVQLAGTLFFNVSTGVAHGGRPVRAGRAPARVAARRHRLGLLPGRQRAGLVRGLPRLGRLASPLLGLVDHPGQPGRVRRLRRVRRGRLHQPVDRPGAQRRADQPGHLRRRAVLPGRGAAAPPRTHRGRPAPASTAPGGPGPEQLLATGG